MEATGLTHRDRVIAFAVSKRPCRSHLQVALILGPVAWSLAGALILCSAWLLVRRLTGAFTTPLDGLIIFAIGFCAVLAAAAARLLWRRAADEPTASARRFRDWLPTVALVLVATSAAVPGSSPAAVVLVWGMITAEEVAAAWLGRLPKGAGRKRSIATKYRAREGFSPRRPPAEVSALDRGSGDVWQHHTRQRAADGQEFVHGTLRISFVAGQRTAIEHLVFCPMLAAVPRLMAMALDESDCTVRATHAYRYGARLEIRLSEPCDEPMEVLVRYEAQG